jgi:hypothetical protein
MFGQILRLPHPIELQAESETNFFASVLNLELKITPRRERQREVPYLRTGKPKNRIGAKENRPEHRV